MEIVELAIYVALYYIIAFIRGHIAMDFSWKYAINVIYNTLSMYSKQTCEPEEKIFTNFFP